MGHAERLKRPSGAGGVAQASISRWWRARSLRWARQTLRSDVQPEVRHDLLLLALGNAGRSVPLLMVAGGFVAWMGVRAGALRSAGGVVTLTLLSALWRFVMARRHGAHQLLALDQVGQIEAEVRANALLAGLTWAVATVGIYPLLDARSAAVHLVILVGSAAVAVHFMTMVRWSYALLVLPSIGSLMLVSLVPGPVHSLPMGVLSCIYAATLLKAGQQYRETAAQAIAHRLDAEAANGQLVKAKDSAEAGALAKSQFLATMSHEIRTPMNGVLGSLDMLRRLPLSDEQRQLVRTAHASGQSLMAILNDVLDHAKIEAGKLTLQPGPMSLREVAAQVVGLFSANAESKGLHLKLHYDEQLPEWVIGDSQRLKQVLLNLVSNAIKFTEAGSVNLGVSCLSEQVDSTAVLFEVRDTGCGISATDAQQLFVPFSQLPTVPGRSRRGTGLGLTISQRIVEAMGGKIEVASEPGLGCTFLFNIDMANHRADPPPPSFETASSGFDLLSPIKGTVLVVEDDAVNRLIARSQLESLGMTVLEAKDGEEALDPAHFHVVDMVFMDCHMSGLDGYAATVRWREREVQQGLRRTPIIAFTANAYDDEIGKARTAGMDSHLIKPYTREQLRAQLQAWL